MSNYRHGLRKTRLYERWHHMLMRCYNQNDKRFARYGQRGISVCEFFRASPANLLLVIGNFPTPKHTLGRINNDGNYSCGACAECLQRAWPLNVGWETQKQQQRNRSNNRLLTFGAETKTMAEWAERAGIPYLTFFKRLKRGRDPFTNPNQLPTVISA